MNTIIMPDGTPYDPAVDHVSGLPRHERGGAQADRRGVVDPCEASAADAADDGRGRLSASAIPVAGRAQPGDSSASPANVGTLVRPHQDVTDGDVVAYATGSNGG